jgi:hypothetical protein
MPMLNRSCYSEMLLLCPPATRIALQVPSEAASAIEGVEQPVRQSENQVCHATGYSYCCCIPCMANLLSGAVHPVRGRWA